MGKLTWLQFKTRAVFEEIWYQSDIINYCICVRCLVLFLTCRENILISFYHLYVKLKPKTLILLPAENLHLLFEFILQGAELLRTRKKSAFYLPI